MNLRISCVITGLLLATSALLAGDTEPLKFNEVFSIIKTNLSDLPQADLSRLAAEGLINELGSKVELITTNAPSEDVAEPITRQMLYNESFAFLRISRIQSNTPPIFEKEFNELGLNKKLKGLVVDLRYADGQDYEAAAELASDFIPEGVVLAKIGKEELHAKSKKSRIELPVVILVNSETKAAAEAFAAMMRERDAALIIGEKTAGEARFYETFQLSTGQKLRVGTIPIELGDGKQIPANGLEPDLQVSIDPGIEKALYDDPYRRVDLAFTALNGTNSVDQATNLLSRTNRPTRRFNEAELVRRHKEGVSLDAPPDNSAPLEPEPSVIIDPALGRALDFLKGLSILRSHKD